MYHFFGTPVHRSVVLVGHQDTQYYIREPSNEDEEEGQVLLLLFAQQKIEIPLFLFISNKMRGCMSARKERKRV